MAGHADARKRIPIVVLVVALVAAGAYWAWSQYGQGSVGKTRLSGTVEAVESQVASVIAGRIESSTATEGAEVAEGALLFSVDDAVLQLQIDQAEAAVRAAKAGVDQAKKDDLSSAEIAAAQAKLDQARAALKMAKVQADYAQITAPAAGVITAVSARPGEIASPGRALATIADLEDLYVSVYVPEPEIGGVTLGQDATVSADGGGEWTGSVDFIATEAEFTPNNIETKDQRVKLVYEVRIRIDSAESASQQLKPGMPVDVVLEAR